MMQVGIFTGYFPYGLKESAEKIRNPQLPSNRLITRSRGRA